MRTRFTKLDDGSKHTYEPDLLPWWKADYGQVRAQEGTDNRPNLRELRDCVMLAVYSWLAPIRLDWATVELKTVDEFKEYIENKEATERVNMGDLKFKKNFIKRNILVVKYEDQEEGQAKKPVKIIGAFFNQMKNIRSFAKTPVEKFLDEEDKARPNLATNIILAFLQERARVGFKSDCLLPFSTYLSDKLAEADVAAPEVDEFSRSKDSKCFTNQSFGERIADLAHLLTGLNFTETLFRRSYISWFWRQPGNDPLKEDVWSKLLPSVHQNSKSANLGYIKDYDAKVNAKEIEWKIQNPGKAVPPALVAEFKRQVVLETEGMLETAANFNPEVDKDDEVENKEIVKDLNNKIKETQQIKAEQKENIKRVEDATRKSARLAALEAKVPDAPQAPPQQPKVQEEEEEEVPAPVKKAAVPATAKKAAAPAPVKKPVALEPIVAPVKAQAKVKAPAPVKAPPLAKTNAPKAAVAAAPVQAKRYFTRGKK